jgi:AcrR family transcriptional regulator
MPGRPEERIRALGRQPGEPRPGPAERLLAEAFVLFYEKGIRAVGVDLLIARSGVAKATFYRYFPSKAALVAAYLARRQEAWLAWLRDEVAARADTAEDRLLAVFDVLADLFADPDYHGCAAVNAVAEVAGEADAVLEVAVTQKAACRDYLRGLAEEAGLEDPDEVTDAWMLLVDGAQVTAARQRGDTAPAGLARRAAELLLNGD